MGQRLPALQPAEMVRALEKAGLYAVRQTGSHVIMYKDGLPRPVPVPIHPGELKRRLQSRIIRQAGLTAEEFSRLLRE